MTLKKTLAVTAITALSLCAVGSGATSASAAPDPDVSITRVHQNVKGVDTPATAKYEWVEFKNNGLAQPMNGWSVEDASGNDYQFPAAFVLGMGARVKVHTGHGIDTATDLYWGENVHRWGNAKDVVFLLKPSPLGNVEEDRLGWDTFYIVS